MEMQAFFMLVLMILRYCYTPVANCNGMPAFVGCVKQRDR